MPFLPSVWQNSGLLLGFCTQGGTLWNFELRHKQNKVTPVLRVKDKGHQLTKQFPPTNLTTLKLPLHQDHKAFGVLGLLLQVRLWWGRQLRLVVDFFHPGANAISPVLTTQKIWIERSKCIMVWAIGGLFSSTQLSRLMLYNISKVKKGIEGCHPKISRWRLGT